MRKVVLESPYAGDVERNVNYARQCLRDCLLRGEAPIASHLLYTQPGVLDDNQPEERQHGIDAGLLWGKLAEASVVYIDYGIAAAEKDGRPVEYRWLFKVNCGNCGRELGEELTRRHKMEGMHSVRCGYCDEPV